MASPQRPVPPPLELDPVPVVAGGTALWGLAGIVLLVLHSQARAHGHGDWFAVCAVGFLLGLLGTWFCLRRRRAIARDAAAAWPARPQQPAQPPEPAL